MEESFKNIVFPETYEYSSDTQYIPIEFYENAFPKAKFVDMVLGYFSSNAIKTLCYGFAEFIFYGGKLRIAFNHELSAADKENLLISTSLDNKDKIIDIFKDLQKLKEELSNEGQHFFDCLKYLLEKGDLLFLPIKLKPDNLAHFKKVILCDGSNYLYAHGSANFTCAGLIKNGESFVVDRSWGPEESQKRIETQRLNFDLIFSRKHPSYNYIKPEEVEGIIHSVGNSKTEIELLEDSINLSKEYLSKSDLSEVAKDLFRKRHKEFESRVSSIKSRPKFPFSGPPRDYQVKAYRKWVENNYKGLFSMATGTGKTITALNCLLEEWKKNGHYRAFILVPTSALAQQWKNESMFKFNFTNTLYTGDDKEWVGELNNIIGCIKGGIDRNFIIITTYALFKRRRFQEYFKKIEFFNNTITLIADEAHALGAPGALEKLPTFLNRRIGLSATPERKYDEHGNDTLTDFFKASPPNYTIVYTMKKAIEDGILCQFNYYPRFCSLTQSELKEYLRITKQLTKYLDSKSGKYVDHPDATRLLILRKSIIHKASEKITVFNKIVDEDIGLKKLKYTFIYVPEGFEPKYWEETNDNNDENEDRRLIDLFSQSLGKKGLKVAKFLGDTLNKDKVLELFAQGKYHALIAMKCLDEGIDIPRAEYAIFCSSTGNPRQFIQRRGRVLRNHNSKDIAKIYDIIIEPDFDNIFELTPGQIQAEKNIFKSELFRIINFAALANNRIEIAEGQLNDICIKLGIENLIELMNKELKSQNLDV